MSQPDKSAPLPAKTPKPPRKHTLKPLVGGKTYTAVSFDVVSTVDSAGTLSGIRIRFYDSAGNLIPDGAIQPLAVPSERMSAVLQSIVSTGANAGETLPQLLLRASTAYVQATYGAQLVAG